MTGSVELIRAVGRTNSTARRTRHGEAGPALPPSGVLNVQAPKSSRRSSSRGRVSQSPVPRSAAAAITFAACVHALRVPAVQQPVGEAGRERVAGADLVDDLLAPGRRDRVHLAAARPPARRARPRAARAAHAARRERVQHAAGVAGAEQRLALTGAAQVPVDMLEHRHPSPAAAASGPSHSAGAVVRVEQTVAPAARARRATSEHGCPRPVAERHRDPGQVHDAGARQRLVRHVGGRRAGSPPTRAVVARPTCARPRATCRTARSARPRPRPPTAGRRPRPPAPRARARRAGRRPAARSTSPARRAAPRPTAKLDSAPAIRAPQQAAQLELAVVDGVQQGHRLPRRDDAGHANGARGPVG